MVDWAREFSQIPYYERPPEEYRVLSNGQAVRKTPKLKGKAAVKANRKARRKAWRQLQDIKRLALAYPESQLAKEMARQEAILGVEVKV